jgi:hypothetical protein
MIDASMGLPPDFFGASRSIQNRLRMLPNFFSRSASASYCRMKTPHTTQLSIPFHMLQATSAANATNESGGEAEIAGGVGVRRGAATRSLRSARGAAHSGAARPAMVVESLKRSLAGMSQGSESTWSQTPEAFTRHCHRGEIDPAHSPTWQTLARPRQERYIISGVSARCIHRKLSSGT